MTGLPHEKESVERFVQNFIKGTDIDNKIYDVYPLKHLFILNVYDYTINIVYHPEQSIEIKNNESSTFMDLNKSEEQIMTDLLTWFDNVSKGRYMSRQLSLAIKYGVVDDFCDNYY